MSDLYEIIFKVAIEKVETPPKVAIEKVEPPPKELSGLLFPIRTPVILPIRYCAMFSPEVLKDAEALSALFRAAEEKLMEKIQGEIKRSKDGADD